MVNGNYNVKMVPKLLLQMAKFLLFLLFKHASHLITSEIAAPIFCTLGLINILLWINRWIVDYILFVS